jgi:IQ and AAA domain-containing protein
LKNFTVDLENLFDDCENQWKLVDENRHELPINDWITVEAFADVHKQLRLIVDDFMRIELELLRVALSRDKRTKHIPQKLKKPIKDKNKKRKENPRETFDLVIKRGLNECYQELKSMNVNIIMTTHH